MKATLIPTPVERFFSWLITINTTNIVVSYLCYIVANSKAGLYPKIGPPHMVWGNNWFNHLAPWFMVSCFASLIVLTLMVFTIILAFILHRKQLNRINDI